MMKDIKGFWTTTKQYFDDQAHDFLALLQSPSESSTYGYNHLELRSVSKGTASSNAIDAA